MVSGLEEPGEILSGKEILVGEILDLHIFCIIGLNGLVDELHHLVGIQGGSLGFYGEVLIGIPGGHDPADGLIELCSHHRL